MLCVINDYILYYCCGLLTDSFIQTYRKNPVMNFTNAKTKNTNSIFLSITHFSSISYVSVLLNLLFTCAKTCYIIWFLHVESTKGVKTICQQEPNCEAVVFLSDDDDNDSDNEDKKAKPRKGTRIYDGPRTPRNKIIERKPAPFDVMLPIARHNWLKRYVKYVYLKRICMYF